MTQSMPVTELTFVELLFSQQRFINNSHSKLHENSVKDSVTDRQSDRQIRFPNCWFYFNL